MSSQTSSTSCALHFQQQFIVVVLLGYVHPIFPPPNREGKSSE